MEEWGLKLRPVAYYSTRLDPVAQAMCECLQAVVAAALDDGNPYNCVAMTDKTGSQS